MAAVCNACGRFLGLCIQSKVQTRRPSRISERNARGVSPSVLTSSRYTSISASSNDFSRWLYFSSIENRANAVGRNS
jgi:hypothetical protein